MKKVCLNYKHKLQFVDAYSFNDDCKKNWNNMQKEYDVNKIIVTTNEITLPAQKNYESVGFVKVRERINKDTPFAGKYIDYEIVLK